jgi:hypothetical protein
MMMERDPEGLEASQSPESALNQYRPPKPEDLPPGMKPLEHIPTNLDAKIKELLGGSSENPADSPMDQRSTAQSGSVDWSYLDAIERREIDVSKFPKWAREFLDDIEDPEQRKETEQMLLEQFSNKALYDDAYFEEDDDEEHDT